MSEDVERAKRFINEWTAYHELVFDVPDLALEFASVRAEEREACIRDLYTEAATWNEGSGALSHMEFAERRIRARKPA